MRVLIYFFKYFCLFFIPIRVLSIFWGVLNGDFTFNPKISIEIYYEPQLLHTKNFSSKFELDLVH